MKDNKETEKITVLDRTGTYESPKLSSRIKYEPRFDL